jgi:hypothetical protein
MVLCEKCGADLAPYDYLTHACVRTGPDVRLRVVRTDGRVEWFPATADVVLGPGDRMAAVPAEDAPTEDAPPGDASPGSAPDGGGTPEEGPA